MVESPQGLRISRGTTYVTRPSLPTIGEYVQLLRQIWASRILTNNGPFLARLETRLKRYLHVDFVDVVANGTLALQLATRAAFERPGSVVTTPFTFPATTTSLIWEGFSPRFVDIDPDTYNLNPDEVESVLDPRTVGILSVHVFGNIAGSDRLDAIARRRHVPLLFDGAHIFGVRLEDGSPFNRGDATTLSFHATKGYHTFEGGAVVSRAAGYSKRIRLMRNFGIASEEDVELAGINAKMSEAHAAMGLLNLRYLDDWIRLRRARYLLYVDLLRAFPEVLFQKVDLTYHNFTYMPILLPSRRVRDRVYANLLRARVHPRKYFYPLTSAPIFSRKYLDRKIPNAVRVADRVLTLPLYPDLPLSEVHRIVKLVRETLSESSR